MRLMSASRRRSCNFIGSLLQGNLGRAVGGEKMSTMSSRPFGYRGPSSVLEQRSAPVVGEGHLALELGTLTEMSSPRVATMSSRSSPTLVSARLSTRCRRGR